MMYEEFTLTKGHVKLLRNVHIRWSDVEFGAPGIDEKRPFGFSGRSSIERGICDMLDCEPEYVADSGEAVYDEETIEDALETYYELETALKIVLSRQTFLPGVFKRDVGSEWHRKTVVDGDDCPQCGTDVIITSKLVSKWRCPNCQMTQFVGQGSATGHRKS